MFNPLAASLASSVGGGLLDLDQLAQQKQQPPVEMKVDQGGVGDVVSQSFNRARDQFSDLVENPFGGLQGSLRATADLVSDPVQAYEQQVMQAMAGQKSDPLGQFKRMQQQMQDAELMYQDGQKLVQLPTGGFMNSAQMRLM